VDERRRDPFYRAAQREGLRSRAAFKLADLDQKFHLLLRGARVLDLGAAPGGWSLVARERVGRNGEVVAVDLRPVEPIEGVVYVRGRVGDPRLVSRLGEHGFDLVLSDMSPRISGAYATDHARSVGLVSDALRLATDVLVEDGTFVAKVFDGDLLPSLEQELSRWFASVRRTKSVASREASSELYLIARRFHPAATGGADRPSAAALDI
jgi:23S rRNA (uridine2552-2'-O)-methyltransferase